MSGPRPHDRARAERRATISQRPMVLGRHRQSAGTVCVRPQFAKPARIPLGAEPGHKASCGRLVPGEGLCHLAQRGLQGRSTYPSVEGQTWTQAERRAAPKPACIPLGDRPTYPSVEGQT